MIERFRKKFIAIATAAIGMLLILILSGINIANFTMVAADADQLTSALAENGGAFQEPIPRENPGVPPEEGGDFVPGGARPDGPEKRMSARYFTIKIDGNGNASAVKIAMSEFTVTEAEAIQWAVSLANGSKGWTRVNYRYRVYNYENYTYVSVVDYSRELSPSYRVLWGSLIGSAVGIVITFALLIPISKALVKPLIVSDKKQRRFISDASHELKTPLTIISANNQILETVYGESDSTKAIDKQVNRLSSMVKNLNALARLDENREVILGELDLAALSSDAVTAIEGSFEAKGVKFSAEIPSSLKYRGDESMLQKLLSILFENALKYALTECEFHLYTVGERICIKVINDADGIDDGTLDQVFERFYRGEAARASGTEGSGIGLSIAKEIVLRHSGRIIAKGENGRFIIKVEL